MNIFTLKIIKKSKMGANNSSSKNRELISTSRIEHIETSSHELKQLASDLKRQIEEFPLAQYEHFLSIRNDIDIHRETILHEAYSLTRNINSKNIDKIHKKSAQMIEEVTRHEAEFLNNFNKNIKPQLNEAATTIDLENLRQYLEFFKNLEKDLHRNQYQNGRLFLYKNFLNSISKNSTLKDKLVVCVETHRWTCIA